MHERLLHRLDEARDLGDRQQAFDEVRNAQQKIMITNEPPPRVLCGYAFRSDTGGFIRMYPMEEGRFTLPSILPDIAADYANWEVDGESLKVRLNPPGSENRILGLLREVLAELFA